MGERVNRVRVVIPYEPRAAFVPLHERRQRWGIMVAHRRAGKTVACINDLNRAAITCTNQDGRFAYVAPFYNQAKDVAWTYLKRYASPIPGVSINESELRVDYPNGARARLYGADNADRMRGGYLDGVILDEYADMHPGVWPEVIRPMLADRQGWALFIGTPKGRNDFHKRWEYATKNKDQWFTLMLKASDSGLLIQDELEAAKDEMTAEQYAQEFECSFDAAILGAYYGAEIAELDSAGRIGEVAYEPDLPVHLVADLGIDDPSAWIAFQVAHDGIRVLRAFENNGWALPRYVSEIKTWGYKIGDCWLPHDAKVKSLNDGRTRIEILKDCAPDWEFRLIPDHKVIDGINALRLTMPRLWIDGERCQLMLEAWRHYHAEYDEKAKVFKTYPKHDWSSHFADAGRYLAMAWRELKPEKKPGPKLNRPQLVVAPDAAVLGATQNAATGANGININMSTADIIAAIKAQHANKGKRW